MPPPTANPPILARFTRAAIAALLGAAAAGLGGCQAVGFVADAAYRAGDHEVLAKYDGLKDKTFAVAVAADRAVQADHPDAVAIICQEVTARIVAGWEGAGVGAAGVVPPEDVLKYQYQRPGWVTMSPGEFAKALGVERLVYIDLQEYTLTDPGNPYIWNGRAAGLVGVVEADGELSSDMAFREYVSVKFPDDENRSAGEIPRETIQLELLRRFVNRASWLFFTHREPNIIEY